MNTRTIDARSRHTRKSVHADARGACRHSWLSVAWTRTRGTISNIARAVPVVGGVVANIADGLHTGDEHQNAQGEWVSNATGELVVKPPTEALQAQIDATARFNRDEVARVRQQYADLAAQAGIGAGAAIGPAGNIYQQLIRTASQSPILTLVAVVAVVGVVYFVVTD